MHNLYSENKDADQLHGNCAADPRLCFRIIMKKTTTDFLMMQLNLCIVNKAKDSWQQYFKT